MKGVRNLSRTVILLGVVSFFTDVSSEMIYPLLPIFLVATLGVGALQLGWIEGVAETTASILKIISGIWTDRFQKRKPFILAGYGIAGIARPLIGLATAWPFVLLMRFFDRIGKGLRTSPRDALIADVTDPELRGTAYGIHRSMDHAGAVVGPLIAAGLMTIGSVTLRHVFLLSAIPAVIVILIIVFGIHEPQAHIKAKAEPFNVRGLWTSAGRPFKLFLLSLMVFTLGNSTDAFLLLRLKDAGISTTGVALLWSLHHVIKMTLTYMGGRLADRVGRRFMIIAGWAVYAVIYFAFAVVDSKAGLIVVFLAYGIYFGLCEPAEKALVADLAPQKLRGTAFGFYHAVIGLAALPASVLFGFLWLRFGAPVAFYTGAALAAAASAMFFLIKVDSQEAEQG